MPLRSGLTVYLATAPTSAYYSQSQLEIGSQIRSLSFASAAPGGFTTFEAILPLKDARLPLPVYALFSLIAVMDGPDPVWLGELTDPEIGMDETNGEYIRLSGLGLGNALRDNPYVLAYAAQTAPAIVKDVLSRATNGSPFLLFSTISTDNTYIFPDSPASTFSPVYDNRTFEEIIADACQLAGDYTWGVWAHPVLSKVNSINLRLGLLKVTKRDTATTSYIASISDGDITKYNLAPSAERAYNRIRVDYTNAAGGVGVATYTDPRLDPTSLAQNNAPFRFRALVRDYTGTSTIGATQAQNIANTYGAQYKDVSNKLAVTLQRIFDPNGDPVPLWRVNADNTNLFIRDFAQRAAAPLPTAPTAGVNQFYLVNAEYREDASGAQSLEIQGDNFVDRAAIQIARLTLAADVKARSSKTTAITQIQGAAASGYVVLGQNNSLSGVNCSSTMQWPNQLYQAPTSVSFSTITSTNLGSPSLSNAHALGGRAVATTTGSGSVIGVYTYTTSGNCIRRIGRKYLDWHCDGCGKEFKDLAIARFVRVQTAYGTAPGDVGLAIDCPECAVSEHPFTESFNTALTREDETHTHHHYRAEQATLIRQLMRHGAVGLEVLP